MGKNAILKGLNLKSVKFHDVFRLRKTKELVKLHKNVDEKLYIKMQTEKC